METVVATSEVNGKIKKPTRTKKSTAWTDFVKSNFQKCLSAYGEKHEIKDLKSISNQAVIDEVKELYYQTYPDAKNKPKKVRSKSDKPADKQWQKHISARYKEVAEKYPDLGNQHIMQKLGVLYQEEKKKQQVTKDTEPPKEETKVDTMEIIPPLNSQAEESFLNEEDHRYEE